MFLPRAALGHPHFSLVVILLFILMGILSFFSMPRSEDPQFDIAITAIEVVYPGASPQDVETLVVEPLEEEISELEFIEKIATDIKNGGARIEVTFIYGTDPDKAYDDVVRAVGNVKPDLPDGVEQLFVFKASPTSVNILQLALWSEPLDYKEMGYQAQRLEKRLEKLKEVRKSDVWGLPLQIVEVKIDPDKLRQYQIPLDRVTDALSARATNITPGFIDASERRFNLRASGNFTNLEQVQETIVHRGEHSAIRIADIAEVSFTSDEPSAIAYYSGKPVLFITVEQLSGENIYQLTEKLEAEIALFKKTLPKDMELETLFRQVDSVERRVDGFFQNLIQGLVVVALLSLLFLGFKESLIVTLTVPLSFVIAIGWLDLSGFGLEQMSIVGLIIALGLLVDNAIVVTESIHRVKGEKATVFQAAASGASRVGWAVTSGSITTMLAFLPMLMLQSSSGDFMRSMPVTVVLVLIASLFIALTLTPLLAAQLLTNGQSKLTLQYFTTQFAERFYRPFLNGVINMPFIVLLLGLGIAAGLLSQFNKVGVALFPKAEKPILMVNVETPPNTSLYQTDKVIQGVARELRQEPLIRDLAINVGNANPRIYYNEIPRRGESNYGQILLLLSEYNETQVSDLISRFRAKYASFNQAEVTIKEFQQGPVADPPITIRLIGDDIAQLQAAARKLERKMRRVEGLVNVSNTIAKPSVELSLDIDYDHLALSNSDIFTLEQSVKTLLSGSAVGVLKDNRGEDYPVVVQSEHPELQLLSKVNISTSTGQQVPLSQVVTPVLTQGHPEFFRFQKIRTAKVTGDAASGYSVAQLTAEVVAYLEQVELPLGVSYEIGGEEESRKENFSGLSHVMLVSAIGIFAVLVFQFRSFLQPVVIFTSIPFAVAGAVLGLLLAGYPFSLMAFVGLISLFGIVVNNAIILVDSTNYNLHRGMNKRDAVLTASATRFTPILLTTLTTIGGLIPLTIFGGKLWAPLGWVIIAGLGVSTLSSLLIVPLLTEKFTRSNA